MDLLKHVGDFLPFFDLADQRSKRASNPVVLDQRRGQFQCLDKFHTALKHGVHGV